MNKKISTPVAIIIIILCVLLAGLIIWQYRLIPEISWEKIPFLKKLEKPVTIEDFNLTQIKEYLGSIKSGHASTKEWNFATKEKSKALIVNFTNNGKQISFLELPSKYCYVTAEDGGVIYGGNIENFMSYQSPSGDYVDNYKTGEYTFCLKPYTLSSVPPEYRWNFDSHEVNVNIPKNCSANINDINKECVCDLATDSLIRFANKRFDVILYENLSWITKELKEETAIVKEEFNKMSSSCSVQEIFIVKYEGGGGSLLLAATLDSKILGLLVFSPLLP